jgi:hypothetical protein
MSGEDGRRATRMRPVDPPESPHERAEREALERATADAPLRGRPLPRRARLGRPTLEGYLTAVGGPLPYMLRLRLIEDRIRAHERALGERWRGLAQSEPTPERFEAAWRAIAAGWDFRDVNDLVERHNRWYPVEARLAMDPRTGDYALVGGRPYKRDPLDAAWVLECFPPARERT